MIAHSALARRAGQLIGALLPQDCQLCTAPSGHQLLCSGCRHALPRLESACPLCAVPTPTGEICGACLRKTPHFDATRAALRYAFPADSLIQALKYRARLPIAVLLAELISESLPNELTHPDMLIPMPLHSKRLAERGFNQAVEISRSLAALRNCRLEVRGLSRLRNTAPQADLPATRRRANVRGAFACTINLMGMNVAVVDDVMTTGATLEEVARVLKKAGALRVENWVAARTAHDDMEVFV